VEPTVRRPPLPEGEPVRTRATRISRSGRRRRPSGEAPPLPRPLTTGTYWLAATGVVLLLWLLALANSATNNYILSFDLTLLEWVSQLRTLVLTDVMRGVHALGSLWTIRVLFWATVAVLLFTRRFRHLFVFLRAVVGVIALSSLLAYLFMRPRPVCCSPPELGPGRRRIGAARGSPGSSSWITTSHLAIADTPACTTVLRPFPSSWMLDRPSGAASSKALTHH
jgi:hypothetical protein